MEGVHPKTISETLGHSSIMQTTVTYWHLMKGLGDNAVDGESDDVYGQAGDDTINTADGESDLVSCGEGNDEVTFVEGLDSIHFCEVENSP
jgi:hypothetical protein